jgi:hypothetical protein
MLPNRLTLPNRLRLGSIAAWLGVIALALNALAPVHIAFDLAHALAPNHHREDAAADRDFVRCLLTLVIGHHDEDEGQSPSHNGHHHTECAVCGAVGTLAGFAPAPAVLLAVPVDSYVTAVPPPVVEVPHALAPAAYRSRAPPVA